SPLFPYTTLFRSRIGKPHGSPGLKPLGEHVSRQQFARIKLDHLAKPGLCDIKHEKASRDNAKDETLGAKCRKIPLLDGIVERLVPGIEGDLGDDRRANNKNNRDGEEGENAAALAGPERCQEITQGAD